MRGKALRAGIAALILAVAAPVMAVEPDEVMKDPAWPARIKEY